MLDLSLDLSEFGNWHATNLSQVRANTERSPKTLIADCRLYAGPLVKNR